MYACQSIKHMPVSPSNICLRQCQSLLPIAMPVNINMCHRPIGCAGPAHTNTEEPRTGTSQQAWRTTGADTCPHKPHTPLKSLLHDGTAVTAVPLQYQGIRQRQSPCHPGCCCITSASAPDAVLALLVATSASAVSKLLLLAQHRHHPNPGPK